MPFKNIKIKDTNVSKEKTWFTDKQWYDMPQDIMASYKRLMQESNQNLTGCHLYAADDIKHLSMD